MWCITIYTEEDVDEMSLVPVARSGQMVWEGCLKVHGGPEKHQIYFLPLETTLCVLPRQIKELSLTPSWFPFFQANMFHLQIPSKSKITLPRINHPSHSLGEEAGGREYRASCGSCPS